MYGGSRCLVVRGSQSLIQSQVLLVDSQVVSLRDQPPNLIDCLGSKLMEFCKNIKKKLKKVAVISLKFEQCGFSIE